jgi:hypothetical protein
MIWFIAIGAVIVSGAVAGATWDQRKGRSRDTTAWSSVHRHRRISRPVPKAGIHAMSCDRWRPTSPRLTRLAGAPELLASARRTPSTGTTLPRRGGCQAGRAERPRIMTAATTCCRWSRLLPCPPSRPSCHRTGCTGCNGGSGSRHARLRVRNGRLASAAKSRLAALHHGFRARPR